MIKRIIKSIALSFDHKEETGADYKKLTAFWFVIITTLLLSAYCISHIELWLIGIKITLREDLVEFKWILGLLLAFILTLVYFTNSKSLSEFIIKLNEGKNKDAS